jgi:hypothetical protein
LTTIAEEKTTIEKHTLIDERVKNLNLSKGLIESLNNAGFTLEMIINSHPSDIAQILGIDDYVAQIIYQETKYYYYQMNIYE